MSQSQRKIQPAHEEQIWEWRRASPRRKTLRECKELLAKGSRHWPAVDISEQTINETFYRLADDRGELYDARSQRKPPTERLDRLVHRLIGTAERETMRVERQSKAGKLDSSRLVALSKAVRSLYDLHERAEREKGQQDDDHDQEQAPEQPRTSFAEQLAEAAAVPPDPTSQDTAQGTEPPGEGGDGPGGFEASQGQRETQGDEAPTASSATTVGEQGSDGGGDGRSDFAPSGLIGPAATAQLRPQSQS